MCPTCTCPTESARPDKSETGQGAHENPRNFGFIGHPSARVTSQDGQYTLHVYVKKGGVKSDKFPADRPAGQRLTAQYTIDLRPFRYGYLFGGLQDQ